MAAKIFSSESVTEGHPDKICDAVSDAILDAMLKDDPKSRVAVETLVTTGSVIVAGEVTTKTYVDVQRVVRETLREIGYTNPEYGIDCQDCGVLTAIHSQSQDIAVGVDSSATHEQGAGDQGMMFGYACDETPQLMPLPITLAHAITMRLTEARKKGEIKWLRPDGKSQVSVEYVDGLPKRVAAVVVAAQHNPEVDRETIKREIIEKVVKVACGKWLDEKTQYFVNGTGVFITGGPEGDTGVTGRKIIVDTYGGMGRHGGGCFCVGGGSIVNTENGLAPISELSSLPAGTSIKTDISPTPLGEWIDNGEMEVLEIETEDGYSLEGTLNQSIRVIDAHGNYVWRRADELQVGDCVAIQRKNRLFGQGKEMDFAFRHKPGTNRKNTFSFPERLTEGYSYLMGLLVGDGRCTTRDGAQVCVCEKEMEENVQALFRRLFGRDGKIFGHWAFFCGVELRAYLEKLGLGYCRSWQKRVPESVFTAPKPVVAAFLRGLMDTDGTVGTSGRGKSACIKLTTTSRELATGVQQLLLNFAIVSHIQPVKTTGKVAHIGNRPVISTKPLYHLRIKGSDSISAYRKEIGFGLSRKAKILEAANSDSWHSRLTIPYQHERLKRLWAKLDSRNRQKDIASVGRILRDPGSKGTKELTYGKLTEFLDAYEGTLAGDCDFEYLRTYHVMAHYYARVKSIKPKRAHVYDFNVPGAHTFTANGFVCHNSGKDPSKVDRSAAYMARYIAKNIVAAGLAKRCEIQLSYCIGVAKPTSVYVDTFGTGKISDEKIAEIVEKVFGLKPAEIIKALDLLRPIYKKTASYGHFGRELPEFTWERTDKKGKLRKLAGI